MLLFPPRAILLAQDSERFRVMFYNVENLFDVYNDSLILDEEFLPEGEKRWDKERYYTKLNNIYRVVISCGEWDPPAVVGLCEVENRKVLEDLVHQTPLKKFDYRIVHFDSPDARGIDVALIYRNDLFRPDTACPLGVRFPFDPEDRTRDILYVRGTLGDRQEVHFFVNHWPSRYGGYEATRPKRQQAAQALRAAIDSILVVDPAAGIVAMGDFNDGPFDESMQKYLMAGTDTTALPSTGLVNLTARHAAAGRSGTLKYKENWDVFDQLVVSGNLMMKDAPLCITDEGARIHTPDFLLEEDETYLGVKPYRTYLGMKYNNGFSDHLPVFLDLKIR